MTDRLKLYNGALLELKERLLDSVNGLTEDRPARRYLDEAWTNGAVDTMLSTGQYTFAKRYAQLTPSASVTPAFGESQFYDKPADFLLTTELCADEFFNVPLLDYKLDARGWYSNCNPIYIGYLSNDAAYGGDPSLWSAEFAEYAKLFLADKIMGKLTGNKTDRGELQKLMARKLKEAKSADAMEKPTQFMPMGTWARARLGGRGGGYDRGNQNRLIG